MRNSKINTKKFLLNLEEENFLIDEVNKITNSIFNKKKELMLPVVNRICHFNSHYIQNIDGYLNNLKLKKIDSEIKLNLLIKDIFKLKNKNKKAIDNFIYEKGKKDKAIDTLHKEYSFIINLTKIRIINYDEYKKREEKSLIGYIFNIDADKLILIEYEEVNNNLETAEIFWREMTNLYN